jgi:hypothetical protein
MEYAMANNFGYRRSRTSKNIMAHQGTIQSYIIILKQLTDEQILGKSTPYLFKLPPNCQ